MKRTLLLLFMLGCTLAYAASTTTNYSLYKPGVGDTDWGALVNTNFDTIDSTMKTNEDAIAVNTAKTTNATHTGDVTGSGALTIGNDKVLEAHLKSVNAATDEYCLTYESTTGDFEWETCNSAITGSDTEVLFFDGANSPAGDAEMTYNKTTDTLTVGSVNTTAAGQSTIDEGLVVNNDGGATETHDFVVNTDTVSSALECDAGDEICIFEVPLKVAEAADAPADVAGYGTYWYDSDDDKPKFTDDAGTDYDLTAGTETNSLETTITGIADTEVFIGNGADSGTFAVFSGDATLANTGAVTVADDSHNHTTTTLSGIVNADLSGSAGITNANLALTAGRSLTEATNDIAADAELYTVTKCAVIETPTDADNFMIYHVELGMQITRVHCIVEDATSATIEIEQCDVAGDNCTVVTTALVCDVGGEEDDGTIDNPDLDVDDWVRLDVTATSGTPGHVTACFTATMDD